MYQAWARYKQIWNAFSHDMQSYEVISHSFFDRLDYYVSVLLNSELG